LKILAVHANYVTLGGEDVSHETEVAFLRASNHDVLDYRVSNSDFAGNPKPVQAAKTIYNKAEHRRVRSLIESFAPDVLYVNNTFPGLSISPVLAANELGLPVVQVLRNYRRGCIAGSTFRDGAECTLCVGQNLAISGVVHRCYRSSYAASAVVTAAKFLQIQKGWSDTADRYIAVSHHVKQHAESAGLPSEKLVVRHNLVWPEPELSKPERDDGLRPFVYVGRDSPEKGLHILLDAAVRIQSSRFSLDVYGCRQPEGFSDDRVRFHGSVPPDKALEAMGNALCVVVPSTWPEPFGRVVIESLACGTPVIASRVGGMGYLGGVGVDLVVPGDSAELAKRLEAILRLSTYEVHRRRLSAREQFSAEFSPQRWLRATESVFEEVLESRRREFT
jgi:hypothetical protein